MANFAFIKDEWPEVFADSAKAESYVFSDPRAACFYSRRVVEVLVHHIYALEELQAPYRDDLAAHLNDSGFKISVGPAISAKLDLIRRVGNSAVHADADIPQRQALAIVQELHHVIVWAAYAYSAHPDAVPTARAFDPDLAQRSAPLSHNEILRLAAKFQEQDRAHARALEESDEKLAAKDEEITRLRAQVAAAQEAKTATFDHDLDEAGTRDTYIDLLLREAGWRLDDARDREFPVDGVPTPSGRGFVDYVLWDPVTQKPLALVEAKRTARSAHHGQQQALVYADALEEAYGERPVIFYTNGYDHWIWDDEGGYPPRQVHGFYTRDELVLLIQRRRTRTHLSSATIDPQIAGRPYQQRAITAVDDAFQQGQRQTLLVMATGAGKTRTVIALVKQLMKANWVKRVLFLADRNALVKQAVGAFTEHLPTETTVNLVTERNTEGRVFVSTYPTMMNRLGEKSRDTGEVRFGPGYFDLIIIDEAHRSVYAKYGFLFEYFDSLLVGLTATPKDEVDHNTYRLFRLEDGVPTDNYDLADAVDEGYLVPYSALSVGTKFLRQGIRYDDLTAEEKAEWDLLDWGEDGAPDEVGAGQMNTFLFNTDTIDKVLADLMLYGRKVAGGDRLGKTVVFAKNQNHAELIQKRFDENFPHHAGKFARVITHSVTYAQQLIDDFSLSEKYPQIAISVDMMDTGIDVPDVVNLVFLKPVFSKSKFWQMIGRGTRLRPDLYGMAEDKTDFLVLDYCGNFEYFSQEGAGRESRVTANLTQRIIENRVQLLAGLDGESGRIAGGGAAALSALRSATAGLVRDFIHGLPAHNVLVRPHRRELERLSLDGVWDAPLSDDEAEAVLALSGLPSAAAEQDEDAKRFDVLVLKGQLAQLNAEPREFDRVRVTVQDLAAALLSDALAIPAVAQQAELLQAVGEDDWWLDTTLPLQEDMRVRMRGLIGFLEKVKRQPVYSDFEDEPVAPVAISYTSDTPGVDFERFTAKAKAFLTGQQDHVALQRLRRNRQLTADDFDALQRMLEEAGADAAVLTRAQDQEGDLGSFVRSLVGLDREAAQEAFAEFLEAGAYTSAQIRFIEMIIKDLTFRGNVSPDRFYQPPYTQVAPAGPEQYFGVDDMESIRKRLADIRNRAVPQGSGQKSSTGVA